tara:strand:- start:378 stop:551 length:174 start_codon:yes stop_codon:yes gene_type:complete
MNFFETFRVKTLKIPFSIIIIIFLRRNKNDVSFRNKKIKLNFATTQIEAFFSSLEEG